MLLKMYKISLCNWISIVVCNVGLFYQTFILLKDFYEGKTMVNVRIGRIYNETLPAITICYPELISFEKVTKFNEEWQDHYKSYISLIKKLNSSLLSKDDQLMLEFHHKYYRNITKNFAYDYTLNDLTMFDNLSIKLNLKQPREISAFIFGDIFQANASNLGLINKNNKSKNFYEFVGQPVESSIVIIDVEFGVHPVKCFTFLAGSKRAGNTWMSLLTK